MNLKMMIDCIGCKYCQPIVEYTKDGCFQMLGQGCYRAPHWGKPIATIEECPKYFIQIDIDKFALGLEKFKEELKAKGGKI